ncbi:uncharacterized protein LY79DRAFT_580089 [Colletotrichum navitas]|uniref:Uncharacterized protein n=1 Tax=Colletotrichum navitas TaxID=681940 RepID=A0AAD8Q0A9_9PEZI|nr:uncharacterized protein LY79DRAFT_580089 [Colletotrichum navitas]KAK1590382.1 hypothetical protein LY79DRAFT_580089 [Colletotrichum navitas]
MSSTTPNHLAEVAATVAGLAIAPAHQSPVPGGSKCYSSSAGGFGGYDVTLIPSVGTCKGVAVDGVKTILAAFPGRARVIRVKVKFTSAACWWQTGFAPDSWFNTSPVKANETDLLRGYKRLTQAGKQLLIPRPIMYSGIASEKPCRAYAALVGLPEKFSARVDTQVPGEHQKLGSRLARQSLIDCNPVPLLCTLRQLPSLDAQ